MDPNPVGETLRRNGIFAESQSISQGITYKEEDDNYIGKYSSGTILKSDEGQHRQQNKTVEHRNPWKDEQPFCGSLAKMHKLTPNREKASDKPK